MTSFDLAKVKRLKGNLLGMFAELISVPAVKSSCEGNSENTAASRFGLSFSISHIKTIQSTNTY